MGKEELYLGRRVTPDTMAPGNEDYRVKASRLTRHAVCFGMTGSGKTGLCVSLLEELALAGVPLIVIDPKGDMTNLALRFKAQSAEEFQPWIDPSEAERAGMPLDAYAEKTAAMWRKGLSDWGVSDDRIQQYHSATQVRVFTPGSTTGTAVNVLGAMGQPPAGLLDDDEALTELVMGTVASLLSLIGHKGDPITDPAHIVMSQVLNELWRAGHTVDAPTLITQLLDPPFKKVGVFPVDQFFPRDKRLNLAMQLNGLFASPAFAAWQAGDPMDIDALLDTSQKTPINIFYLAHLDDSRRMFFVSTLLNRMLAWSRRQTGTSSLRALLYFDEVYGYLPPHPYNPPSKRAVLTLMKQARAIGLGTMLVTQNPIDVDYSALSNAGTWLVGRLQTEQDQNRVIDGLTGASGGVDKATIRDWLRDVPARTFVAHDVKEREPCLMHSRWAMSYLRGPLTLRQLPDLPLSVSPSKPVPTETAEPVVAPEPAPVVSSPQSAKPAVSKASSAQGYMPSPPPPPTGFDYLFLDPNVAFSARLAPFFESQFVGKRSDGHQVWEPAVYASLYLRFDEGQDFVVDREEHRLFFPLGTHGVPEAQLAPIESGDILRSVPAGLFAPLPTHLDEARELKALRKTVIDQIYRGETETMYRHKGLKLESVAGETRAAFDVRVTEAIAERVDADVAKLKDKVAKSAAKLDEKKRKMAMKVQRYQMEAQSRQQAAMMSASQAMMGMFLGRRRSVGSAMRQQQQAAKADQKLTQTQTELAEIDRQVRTLHYETERKIQGIEGKYAQWADDVVEHAVRLERNDIDLRDFCVLWVPTSRMF